MIGKIVKGVGGLYTVWGDDRACLCRARGRFRNESIKPEVGDAVDYSEPAHGEDFGAIRRILPRKNAMARPSVVNIDLLFVTVSAKEPEPDLLLADKLLFHARRADIRAELLINKADLADPGRFAAEYALCGYSPLTVSAAQGQGLAELIARMSGQTCAFCGQSGVGKSSILNAVCKSNRMETGRISRNARGRHTTRHVELIRLGDCDAWVADTPGFSLLDAQMIDPQELKLCYLEYERLSGACRYAGCNHIGEPGCAVLHAVKQGALPAGRWERYTRLYKEISEKWSRRYD